MRQKTTRESESLRTFRLVSQPWFQADLSASCLAVTSGCPPARNLLLPCLSHHAGLHPSTLHELNKSLLR